MKADGFVPRTRDSVGRRSQRRAIQPSRANRSSRRHQPPNTPLSAGGSGSLACRPLEADCGLARQVRLRANQGNSRRRPGARLPDDGGPPLACAFASRPAVLASVCGLGFAAADEMTARRKPTTHRASRELSWSWTREESGRADGNWHGAEAAGSAQSPVQSL